MHPALMNGHTKATIIQSFAGEVFIVRPGFKRDFKNLKAAMEFINTQDWEINIEIIKGSPILENLGRIKE